MRILVIGAGATGGYFGGRLTQAGRDVTFLVRGATAERLRRDGLHIVSPFHGDATVQPKIVTAAEITGPYDLIVLSVKAYGLAAAIEDFAPAVGPETMILPFLNGMHHLDLLAARFGEQPVIGGVCLVSSALGKEGEIVQFNPTQKITYGERDGELTERVQALDRAMQGAGFEAKLSGQIMQDMWEKWVQLASLGASNSLMRGSIGEIVAVPHGAEITLQILTECSAIAAACGYAPRAAMIAQASSLLTTPGSPLTASMYRDLSSGSRVEVDQILGDLLRRGREHEVKAPLLQAAFTNLSIYQSHLS
ncbi:2-dehydropantoate 2-reductase [Granulicella sp. WH15]|uniref:2-dehydropantoate 2-reductase n=1 Tax=Granulicella sp. WH15 TaxID=2602070 RepID=UPI00136740CF|nr:2-dehydropantoate 2-reductase [Granulicella sp. WH15]QHN04843.1 2-dehydropantoate 2-reductase [Granulicella sp. WH15]